MAIKNTKAIGYMTQALLFCILMIALLAFALGKAL